MSIDTDVYATLDGNDFSVYPTNLPLGAVYPAVTYQRIDTRRRRSHDGTALVGPLFQFTAWDTSPTVARATAREVVAIWEPLIERCQIENQGEMWDPGQKLYGVRVDVRVWAHGEEES